MNIVILDLNQRLNAQYYCDKHVIKQITEFNQLLSSVYYFIGNVPEIAYKLYGKNHPCAKWTRESLANWLWLRDMTLELCKEYTTVRQCSSRRRWKARMMWMPMWRECAPICLRF